MFLFKAVGIHFLVKLCLATYVDLSDRYIITLHPSVDLPNHLQHVQHLHVQSRLRTRDGSDGDESVFEGVTHNYTIHTFKAYAGHFSPSVIEALRSNPAVKGVQKDAVLKHDSVLHPTGNNAPDPAQCKSSVLKADGRKGKMHEQVPAPLGLQVIGTNNTSIFPGGYWYDTRSGAGSWVYILDSGLDTSHAEWSGCFKLPRGTLGRNCVPGAPIIDVDGHGTMIAGIIGGNKYGVAKNVRMVSVKVFHRYGLTSWLLDGLKWTMDSIEEKKRHSKAVINICVGGMYNTALNDAVSAVVKRGVPVVTAAGNDHTNVAKHESPASAEGAIVVGATGWSRNVWKLSNFGPEVAIFAPGEEVESAFPGGRKATAKGTGTSMAAPFVAGLIAYFRSLADLPDSNSARKYLLERAVKDVVRGQRGGSANLYAYNDSGR